jgi:hypothetical protein
VRFFVLLRLLIAFLLAYIANDYYLHL